MDQGQILRIRASNDIHIKQSSSSKIIIRKGSEGKLIVEDNFHCTGYSLVVFDGLPNTLYVPTGSIEEVK